MTKKVIIVPSDGATNIKLEIFDFESLTTLHSKITQTPSGECNGLKCNHTLDEFEWFDKTIAELPEKYKNIAVISPVARGASGGLIDRDNRIIDCDNGRMTIAYTQTYPKSVESKFREICNSEKDFFNETGSNLLLPGSLTLIKRLLFEEMIRPETAEQAEGFATYPILLSGHFLGDDFLEAIKMAGNEHSYWMCHTGARNINKKPGTPSAVCNKIKLFKKLVPENPAVSYKSIGHMPQSFAKKIKIHNEVAVTSGGHDTCLSHIPIISTFYQLFPSKQKHGVFHLEIGTWIMGAQLSNTGAKAPSSYRSGTIVQGTVDGFPVPTTMFGGGADYRLLVRKAKEKGLDFASEFSENVLKQILKDSNCFVLPNIDPNNYGTGPFPKLKGGVINEDYFYSSGEKAFILANLMAVLTTAYQITGLLTEKTSIVLTGGGAKDTFFGRLLSTITGNDVFVGYDKFNNVISETTSLGAAIVGKAAYLNIHPYDVDVSAIGAKYTKLPKFKGETAEYLEKYRKCFFAIINKKIS